MRLYVNNEEVDVVRDNLPAYTYSIEDDEDISVVRGARSTTIELPATNNNARILGGYAMGEETTRYVNYAARDGGINYFVGRAQVSTRSDGGYTLRAVGDNATWIGPMRNKRLRGLRMGGTDIVDRAYVVSTWDDIDNPLYFPVVEYGNLELRSNAYDVPFDYLRPSVRVWKFLTAAFQEEGYALRAMGSFDNIWKRLVLLNNSDTVPISDAYIALTSARFDKTTTQIVLPYDYPFQTEFYDVAFPTITTDPSFTWATPGRFDTPFDISTRITLDFNMRAVGLDLTEVGNITVQLYNYTTNDVIQQADYGVTFFAPFVSQQLVFDPLTIVAGRSLGIRVRYTSVGGQYPSTLDIETATIRFDTIDIQYQSGVKIDVAAQAPDLKVLDVFKWIRNLYGLAVETRGNEVFMWHDSEFYRAPGTDFVDLTERMNGGAIKVYGDIPRSYLFEHKTDDMDRTMKAIREANGPFGAGDYDYATGGEDDEQNIEVGFAATAMGPVLETLRVPILREVDAELSGGYYPDKRSGWEPRLCIADGVVNAPFKYAGVVTSVSPSCYSYGAKYTATFGDIGGVPGTVERYMSGKLRRFTGPRLEGVFVWHDHEVVNLSHNVPVKAHDGQMPGFYYVKKLEQHRLGEGGMTKTILIPV